MNQPLSTILNLLDDNHNIEIIGLKNERGNWIFSFRRNANTFVENNNKGDPLSNLVLFEETRWLRSFTEVLAILNQYQWRHMKLIIIHSEFKDIIEKEYNKCGDPSQRNVTRSTKTLPRDISSNKPGEASST